MLTTIKQPTKFYKYKSKVYALVEEQDDLLLLHNGDKGIVKKKSKVTTPTMDEVTDAISKNEEFSSICEMYQSYFRYVTSYS